jgi:hypothetical protein
VIRDETIKPLSIVTAANEYDRQTIKPLLRAVQLPFPLMFSRGARWGRLLVSPAVVRLSCISCSSLTLQVNRRHRSLVFSEPFSVNVGVRRMCMEVELPGCSLGHHDPKLATTQNVAMAHFLAASSMTAIGGFGTAPSSSRSPSHVFLSDHRFQRFGKGLGERAVQRSEDSCFVKCFFSERLWRAFQSSKYRLRIVWKVFS